MIAALAEIIVILLYLYTFITIGPAGYNQSVSTYKLGVKSLTNAVYVLKDIIRAHST